MFFQDKHYCFLLIIEKKYFPLNKSGLIPDQNEPKFGSCLTCSDFQAKCRSLNEAIIITANRNMENVVQEHMGRRENGRNHKKNNKTFQVFLERMRDRGKRTGCQLKIK